MILKKIIDIYYDFPLNYYLELSSYCQEKHS